MTDNEVKWMLVGKLLRRNLMAGVKEATMYRYNGVVLPKLPEWDKEAYPYAYITTSTAPRRLILTSGRCITSYTDGRCTVISTNPYADHIVYELVDDAWVESTFNGSFKVLWCSTDLYYSSVLIDDPDSELAGTLYLAASDPVPIYE